MLALVGPTWVLCLILEMVVFWVKEPEHSRIELYGSMNLNEKVQVSFLMIAFVVLAAVITFLVWEQCHGQWLYPYVQRIWPWSITYENLHAMRMWVG
jgi:hypothetical protein